MISKRLVHLYSKTEDYNEIHTVIFANSNIATYWRRRDRNKDLNRIKKGRKIIHNLKINGCAICGYDKCDNALDFHHVNPQDKKFQIIAKTVLSSSLIVAEELDKCILLCSNCHREIHAKARGIKNDF